jgi:hypothetical protein
VRVLFGVTHLGLLRHYQPVLRELIARGHTLHVVCQDATRGLFEASDLRLVTGGVDGVTFDALPERPSTVWTEFGDWAQLVMDWVRYLSPAFQDATALRTRVEGQVPEWSRRLIESLRRFDEHGRGTLAVLKATDAVVPPAQSWLDFIRDWRPDLVLVSPYVYVGFGQRDLVKAAQLLGVPSAACIASWDNLTNKGVISTMPDRVFVWNDAQRTEAVELHDVPPEQVVVTGAQSFDRWFGRQPSRTREEFCRVVGLDPGRPIVLYLGSSDFIAPREGRFVREWIGLVRSAQDPLLSTAGVLIRPHPKNFAQIAALDLSEFEGVVVWPPQVRTFGQDFDSDFFDSLFHSNVVVGVNTSAQIEAAIVGRAVCTWKADEFAHSQGGTPHFQHLASSEHGMLFVAESEEEHLQHLAGLLRDPAAVAARTEAFVRSFVRPNGLETAAGTVFADAVESLGRVKAAPVPVSLTKRVARALLVPVAVLVRRLNTGRPLWTWPLQGVFSLYVRFLQVREWVKLRYDRVAEASGRAWQACHERVSSVLAWVGKQFSARRKRPRWLRLPRWDEVGKAGRRFARAATRLGRETTRRGTGGWRRSRKITRRAVGALRAVLGGAVRRLLARPRRDPVDRT